MGDILTLWKTVNEVFSTAVKIGFYAQKAGLQSVQIRSTLEKLLFLYWLIQPSYLFVYKQYFQGLGFVPKQSKTKLSGACSD